MFQPLLQMAESLEHESSEDTDRILDSNSFLNSQFEIFTHDYRELKEVPKCSQHEGGSGCCGDEKPEETAYKKKDVVNITRKLQRAIANLEGLGDSGPISSMITQLKDVNERLQTAIKIENSEFSTSSVKLPEYDPIDMHLLLGKEEVPSSMSMLEKVADDEKKSRLAMVQLLGEAEIMIQEYDHFKRGLRT